MSKIREKGVFSDLGASIVYALEWGIGDVDRHQVDDGTLLVRYSLFTGLCVQTEINPVNMP